MSTPITPHTVCTLTWHTWIRQVDYWNEFLCLLRHLEELYMHLAENRLAFFLKPLMRGIHVRGMRDARNVKPRIPYIASIRYLFYIYLFFIYFLETNFQLLFWCKIIFPLVGDEAKFSKPKNGLIHAVILANNLGLTFLWE